MVKWLDKKKYNYRIELYIDNSKVIENKLDMVTIPIIQSERGPLNGVNLDKIEVTRSDGVTKVEFETFGFVNTEERWIMIKNIQLSKKGETKLYVYY